MRTLGTGAAAAALAFLGAQAHADELRGRYVHLGAAQISPNPNSVELSVAGASVPGASINASSESGMAAEVGWFIYGNWAVSLAWTSSVLTENIGGGSLAATPDLGSDAFMLASLTGHYHFNVRDWFEPYVGAGLGYFHATGAYDGVVTNLVVGNAFGGVLQAGADFNITDRWGAFVDVKQYLLGIDATGALGGLPVEASADLDPMLINSGLTYRF